MGYKIQPAGDDHESLADTAMAAALWDIWEALKGTPYLWVTEEICAGYGIQIGDSP